MTSSASFTMQYNKQKATLTGVRRSQRKVNDEMIVFDRLIPMNEELRDKDGPTFLLGTPTMLSSALRLLDPDRRYRCKE
ncbi:MAG: hypothetical protein IPH20_21720 [Bacteroidales bacterium]|nr:hypothetical protein [Bacteroidales bacterium]